MNEPRTNFVAHIGEEFALYFCRIFGFVARDLKLDGAINHQLFKVIAVADQFGFQS